jgi:hypothetical protein
MSGPHAQEISLRAPVSSATHVTPSGRLARRIADGDRDRLARHLAAEVREISG